MLSSATITRPPLLSLLGILGILILSFGLPESAQGTDIEVPSGQPELPPDTNPPPSSPAPATSSATLHNAIFGDKLFLLPANLTLHQQDIAFTVIAEAEPRLIVLHAQLSETLNALHNLSFDSDTPVDALPALGRELIRLRGELLKELQNISLQLEKKVGFNPGWGSRRTGSIHHPTSCPVCAKEREREKRETVTFREQQQPERKPSPEYPTQNGSLQVEQRVLEQGAFGTEPANDAPLEVSQGQQAENAGELADPASERPATPPSTSATP